MIPQIYEYATITLSWKRASDGETKAQKIFTPEFKAKVVLEALSGQSSLAERY